MFQRKSGAAAEEHPRTLMENLRHKCALTKNTEKKSSVMSPGRKTDLPRYGRSALTREIDERLSGRRRLSVARPSDEAGG